MSAQALYVRSLGLALGISAVCVCVCVCLHAECVVFLHMGFFGGDIYMV